jgi:hypothetical protein
MQHVRFPLMDVDFMFDVVHKMCLAPESVIMAAIAFHAEAETAKNTLPASMLRMRRQRFLFDVSQKEPDWDVSPCGRSFTNVAPATEASITVRLPIIRKPRDRRVIRFSVELRAIEPHAGPLKGFFGIGLLDHPLVRFREGVTSKQQGTLYYSNGWISSFGATLDKSGNVPNFTDGDTIGIEINFRLNTIRFLVNGAFSGPVVQLHHVRHTLLSYVAHHFFHLSPMI